jgi:exodeoxyribonuclease VII small subunit
MAEASGGTSPPDDISALSFEDALSELRTIVERLEQGETKLDDAIQAYERGAKLKAHCERKLKEAEAKIEQIRVGQDGQATTQPLDVE